MTARARRLAVTGASSGLGRALIHLATERGFEVVALARRQPADGLLAKHWLPFDLADQTADWSAPLAECEAVLHLAAAKTAEDADDRAQLWAINVDGTCRLIDAMRRARVPQLVLSAAANLPTLDAPSALASLPRALYLASKLAQEWAALAACSEAGIRCAAMRVSSIVGDGRSALDRIAHALLAGEPVHIESGDRFGADLVSAPDVAAGLLLAVEQRLHGTFPLSSGQRTTLGAAARQMAMMAGRPDSLVRIETSRDIGDDGFPAVDCGHLVERGYRPRELTAVLEEIISRARLERER